jgi:peroxiredoxin
MAVPKIGEPARTFRLPSAQGGDVALDDYKGRQSVVLWFTKGMGCPFCRQHVSQLARAYPRIREQRAEILEVTNTSPARAQAYARQFALPFPYLCDPEYRVSREWGLDKRAHGAGYYVKTFLTGMKMERPPSDFGDVKPTLREIPGMLADDDMGFFIVDRAGVVRYALAGPYVSGMGARAIPGAEDIVRELERCAAAA